MTLLIICITTLTLPRLLLCCKLFTYFQKLSHIAKRCVINHLQQEDYISAYNFDLATFCTIQNICIFHFTITKLNVIPKMMEIDPKNIFMKSLYMYYFRYVLLSSNCLQHYHYNL